MTPVHPSDDELEGIKTIRSLTDLPNPNETAVSIITPAKVSRVPRCFAALVEQLMFDKITIVLLQQVKDLSIPAVWCQPGATDVACVQYIKENGMSDRVLFEGECILRDGDGVLQAML